VDGAKFYFSLPPASHYIHSITFGNDFPLSKNPLEKAKYQIENDSGGLALTQLSVKLVPTKYQTMMGSQDMYQLSVTDHVVQPETLATQGSQFLPGMAIAYDFTALAVNHVEWRDNIFVFASSLISIVGGVFVTVSLFTGCLVHSAAAVAKKID
jgi:Endoplasmic reticulum vesicle transporter